MNKEELTNVVVGSMESLMKMKVGATTGVCGGYCFQCSSELWRIQGQMKTGEYVDKRYCPNNCK